MSTISGEEALTKFITLCKQDGVERILDVGAGETEPHAHLMRNKGLNVETSDLFPVSTYQGDYNQYEFNALFDAIWCSHVLEHQLNVNHFLKKIHRDVKEGGIVAVTVPPLKHQIVGGHVSLWNAGLLMYNMVLAGFNCSQAMVKKYRYNISIVVRKDSFTMPELTYDTRDIRILGPYFPKEAVENVQRKKNGGFKRGFNGDIEEINWWQK